MCSFSVVSVRVSMCSFSVVSVRFMVNVRDDVTSGLKSLVFGGCGGRERRAAMSLASAEILSIDLLLTSFTTGVISPEGCFFFVVPFFLAFLAFFCEGWVFFSKNRVVAQVWCIHVYLDCPVKTKKS